MHWIPLKLIFGLQIIIKLSYIGKKIYKTIKALLSKYKAYFNEICGNISDIQFSKLLLHSKMKIETEERRKLVCVNNIDFLRKSIELKKIINFNYPSSPSFHSLNYLHYNVYK